MSPEKIFVTLKRFIILKLFLRIEANPINKIVIHVRVAIDPFLGYKGLEE